MKKIFCILFSVVLMFSVCTTTHASYLGLSPELNSYTYSEDLGNGYYGITTIEFSNLSTYATNQRNGSKTYTIKDSDGNVEASFKLSASFSYSSTSVTCTSATYSTTVNDKSWSFTNTSASKSGATAQGDFTAVCKFLGITIKSITRTITLTCDKNGNLS